MSRDTRIVLWFLAGIAGLILGSAVLCTWAGVHPFPFLLLCHGIPRRCLELFGSTMPVCARCTGIYAGMLLGIAFSMVIPPLERPLRWVAVAAATPMLLDGLSQAAGLRESTNPLRLATGLTAAFVFVLWVASAVETGARQRVTTS